MRLKCESKPLFGLFAIVSACGGDGKAEIGTGSVQNKGRIAHGTDPVTVWQPAFGNDSISSLECRQDKRESLQPAENVHVRWSC